MPEQSDRLFVFEPRNWTHCGGMTLVCARDLGDAVRIGNEAVAEDKSRWMEAGYESKVSERGTFSAGDDADRSWFCTHELVLKEPRDVGVVASNANYA